MIHIKWSNPGKGMVPSSPPWCSSYWKKSFWVAQQHFFFSPVAFCHSWKKKKFFFFFFFKLKMLFVPFGKKFSKNDSRSYCICKLSSDGILPVGRAENTLTVYPCREVRTILSLLKKKRDGLGMLLNQWFPTDFRPWPTLVFLKFWSPLLYSKFYWNSREGSFKAINLVSKQAPLKYCMPHQNITMPYKWNIHPMLGITALNCIWWWDSSFGDLRSA